MSAPSPEQAALPFDPNDPKSIVNWYRGELTESAGRAVLPIDLGQVTAGQIRQRVVNLLSVMDRLGALDEVPGPETTSDDPADLALIRRAGAASMVVLKNSERVLPLDPSAMRRV